jgi:anti-sigma B factor antagonist
VAAPRAGASSATDVTVTLRTTLPQGHLRDAAIWGHRLAHSRTGWSARESCAALHGRPGPLYRECTNEVREVGAMGEAVMTTRHQADGAIVVDVRGTLDAATVDALREALLATLQRDRPRSMIVDLTFVTFMDSMGIGALVTGYNAAREIGASFVLRNPSEFVHRQLRVTGLAELFGLSPTASTPQTYSS